MGFHMPRVRDFHHKLAGAAALTIVLGLAAPVPLAIGATGSAAPKENGRPLSPRSARALSLDKKPSLASKLPSDWAKSSDVVATVQGDGSGLHVLVADEASAYSWRTVATLGDPGVDTNQWIGQGCVTASG